MHHSIELLESRIAPAILLTISADHKTANWVDVDGDMVTLKASKPVLDAADFTFLDDQGGARGAQLALLDLSDIGVNKGVNLTFTAKRNAAAHLGDGSVNVGRIFAAGVDLGSISVAGDLGSIIAGDATTPNVAAVASITTLSAGNFLLETQADPAITGLNPDLGWIFAGKVGTITVKGDFRSGLHTDSSAAQPGFDPNYSIGKIAIWGDLLGGNPDLSPNIDATGNIFVKGNIGSVTVGGNVTANTWDATAAGSIFAIGSIASVSVGGNLVGSGGSHTGEIFAGLVLGKVTVAGSILGGSTPLDDNGDIPLDENDEPILAEETGVIHAGGRIDSVKVGGDVRAGFAKFSGSIHTERGYGGDITSVTINGMLVGSSFLVTPADDSAAHFNGIYADGRLGTVTVGSVLGDQFSPTPIAALGKANPKNAKEALAIGSVTVKRSADGMLLIAGFDAGYLAFNSHVQIGTVKIGNDLTRSSIVAGIFDEQASYGRDENEVIQDAPGFGGSSIRSKIGKLTVGAYVKASEYMYTTGVVAQDIDAVKIGPTALELSMFTRDHFEVGPRGNFFVREIGG